MAETMSEHAEQASLGSGLVEEASLGSGLAEEHSATSETVNEDLAAIEHTTKHSIDDLSSVTETTLRHRRVSKVDRTGSANLSSISSNLQNGHSHEMVTQSANLKHVVRPSSPAHKRIKESPLSSTAIFHQSHAGLFNLCIVILVAVNSRLIIENLMKYGLLIHSGFWFSSKSLNEWPLLMCGLSLPLFSFCSFLVEKLRVHVYISDWVMFLMHFVISTACLICPVYIIHRVPSAVLPASLLMLFSITCWMKLVSYAHTNYDLRIISSSDQKVEVSSDDLGNVYPQNITFKNFAYFMVAPTLCYQVSYPQTEKIRKGWLFCQLVKYVVFTGLMGFIIEQYINPTVRNSQHPLKGNYLYAIERVLKLSIPTLYVWLCMFYCTFHLWLNIIAELTYFGDREFYKDWWNAKTVDEYWKMWNMPVHRWMVRHIYFPCLRRGLSKGWAVVISFIVSGIFHELWIGVPCRMLRGWAFLGIMFQVPLVVLTSYLHKRFQSSMKS